MQEQKQQEAQKIATAKAERIQAQNEIKRRGVEKMQEIRKRLNLPEKEQEEVMPGKKKESKKEEFERQVEGKRKSIQEKLTLLADPEWVNEVMAHKRESGMGKEEIESEMERLESSLEGLTTYQEMKKRSFWKHAWGEFRDANEILPEFLFGSAGAVFAGMGEIVLNGISHGGVAVLDPTGIGAAAIAGAGIGVAVAVGVQTLSAINEAHRERKWAREHAKDILGSRV